jgi:hypothetical protein
LVGGRCDAEGAEGAEGVEVCARGVALSGSVGCVGLVVVVVLVVVLEAYRRPGVKKRAVRSGFICSSGWARARARVRVGRENILQRPQAGFLQWWCWCGGIGECAES